MRARGGLLVLMLALLPALPAAAQDVGGRLPQAQYSRFGAQLKLGLYRPVLSHRASVATIREKIYGPPHYFNKPLLYQLQLQGYPWTQFGLLGFYGRVGFSSASAASRKCTDAVTGAVRACDATSVLSSTAGDDVAVFTQLPLSLGVIYAYDQLRRLYALPLSFVTSVGLDYNLWWGSVGASRSQVGGDPRRRARGGNIGLSATLAAHLALDWFSNRSPPYGSGASSGQNSYVFVEYALMHGQELLRRRNFIDLSDYAVASVGIAIDFH